MTQERDPVFAGPVARLTDQPEVFYEADYVTLWNGDALETLSLLPSDCVHTCVTSPPYWGLRDYKVADQVGLERTPEEYVARMVEIFREVRRVLRSDGTLWLNMGDSYAAGGRNSGSTPEMLTDKQRSNGGCRYARRHAPSGLKPKDLVGIPWRVAFALQADGWYLRSDIIWHKPNPMPESVTDRPTKAHEYLFLMAKSERYFYDTKAIAEPVVKGYAGSRFNTGKTAEHQLGRCSSSTRIEGEQRNRRSVWTISTKPFKEAHFATFPPKLIEPCILSGCPPDGIVLDPFSGAGTTGLVCKQTDRNAWLIELNKDYCGMTVARLEADA